MEFSHRCAAITVRRARRRRRLHNDVGHIAGVISALLDQLKNRKQWSSAQLSVCVCAYVLCDNYLLTGISVSSFSLSKHFMSLCGACAREANTLLSGRIMDWEWLSCCLTSCRGAESSHWVLVSLNAIVLRVSEEAARCMLFKVKCSGELWKGGTYNQRKEQFAELLFYFFFTSVNGVLKASESWYTCVVLNNWMCNHSTTVQRPWRAFQRSTMTLY